MTHPWHPDLAVQVATFGVSVGPGVPLGLVSEEDVGGVEGDGAVVGPHLHATLPFASEGHELAPQVRRNTPFVARSVSGSLL